MRGHAKECEGSGRVREGSGRVCEGSVRECKGVQGSTGSTGECRPVH